MGSEHVLETNPHFEVRAVGSFEPKPGCPDSSREALSPERLDYLCRGECYHPSDQRRPIVAIEIIRIRPQQRAGEAPRGLIEDPWRRFECPPDPAGCRIEFRDEEFVASGRDALYYARALEAPSAALNGQPLETQFDAVGNPVSIVPCTPARIDEGGDPGWFVLDEAAGVWLAAATLPTPTWPGLAAAFALFKAFLSGAPL